jgi:hypothetical protein
MGLAFWLDPRGAVKELVQKWEPKDCHTEKDFERSLAHLLESRLKGKDIVKQFAVGRVRGDIVIEKKILIEIKTNLSSTAKLQRLLGQIELYRHDWGRAVILVLCGEHDPNLVKRLRDALGRHDDSLVLILGQFSLDLIVKRVAQTSPLRSAAVSRN